ncbi:MAG: biliverdin-producing heme oxygenase [Sphingomonas sp.]
MRNATAQDHQAVDNAFGRFDLSVRDGYVAFLTAQSRALLALEAMLWQLPGWRPRGGLIADDLAELGEATPRTLPFAAPATAAEAWGMLYVIEGSRLGGAILAKQVGAGLPTHYLGAVHGNGEWRAFRDRLDAAEAEDARGGDHWRDEALSGAQAAFALFRDAAQ